MTQTHRWGSQLFAILFLLAIGSAGTLSAQATCTLTALSRVQLSIDQTGQALVTWPMVLQGTPTCAASLKVCVLNTNGTARPTPLITCADVGRTLRILVKDTLSGQMAWSLIVVEDKLPPTITASNLTIACNRDPITAADSLVAVNDNCTAQANIQIRVTSQTPTSVGCLNGIAQTITRTIVAVDAQGMTSAPVTQVITITRLNLSDVVFPANVRITSSSTGLCPMQQMMAFPATGPTALGFPLSGTCKFLTSFTDAILPGCGVSKKVLRTFTVLDCCTNQIIRGTQIIEFADDVAPGFVPLPDSLLAQPVDFNCNYSAFLPSIDAMDDCDPTLTVIIRTPLGPINGNGGQLPRPFMLSDGSIQAIYEIRDGCGNVARDTLIVFARDITPPVAVCDENTVISITGDGTVVLAQVFDRGSVINGVFVPASRDNCGPVQLLVRRDMTGPFLPTVVFNCADVGTVVPVELQVIDLSGNVNSCMVSATIQSKLVPLISTPAPYTANCIQRPVPPAISGSPIITQNCSNFSVTGFIDDESTLNNCSLGFAIRTFTITDLSGQVITRTQRINYIDTGVVRVPSLDTIRLDCSTSIDLSLLMPPVLGTACQTYLLNRNYPVTTFPTRCGTKTLVDYEYSPMCGTDVITITQMIIQEDRQAPQWTTVAGSLDRIFSCPDDVPALLPKPTASDDCTSAIVTLDSDNTVNSGAPNCPNFVRTLSYSVADSCGNANPVPFVVVIRVQDNVAPVSTFSDTLIVVQCRADFPATSPTASFLQATDNCGGALSVSVSTDIEAPGNTPCFGTVQRIYTISDACGNMVSVSQTLRYGDTQPPVLDPLPIGGTFECYADIPPADPSVVTGTDGCGSNFMVIFSFTAPQTQNCKDTIIRSYAVEDACGNTGAVTQTFYLDDNTAPVLTPPRDTSTFASEDLCARRISLSATATDRCNSLPITFTNNSPFAASNASATVTGTYPLDTTTITYTATDACNNTSTASSRVIVNDVEPPSFRCRSLFVYLDSTGNATLTDQRLTNLLLASDDCTPQADLIFNVNLPQRNFTCADFGRTFMFTVTATDLYGNMGTCSNSFIVDDSLDVCPAPFNDLQTLRGKVRAPLYNMSIDNAQIRVTHAGGVSLANTRENGSYVLYNVAAGNVAIEAEVNMPAEFGLTTHDLLLASQHIMGVRRLQDPYLLLAADVNGSGSITAYDITLMRRVLLSLSTNFGSPKTCVALDAKHSFSRPSEPWLDRNNWGVKGAALTGSLIGLDISVIKLGDLNPGSSLLPRSGESLQIEDRYVRKGETISLQVRNGLLTLEGLQLALEAQGELEVLAHPAVDLLSNHVAGQLRISVIGEVLPSETLFELQFTPTKDGNLSELLQLSTTFQNEAYELGSLSTYSIALDFKSQAKHERALDVFPNPFTDVLRLEAGFTKAGDAHLRVCDATGRSFAERRWTVQTPGKENFEFDTSNWPSGVYIVSIDGASGSQTKRIILQR